MTLKCKIKIRVNIKLVLTFYVLIFCHVYCFILTHTPTQGMDISSSTTEQHNEYVVFTFLTRSILYKLTQNIYLKVATIRERYYKKIVCISANSRQWFIEGHKELHFYLQNNLLLCQRHSWFHTSVLVQATVHATRVIFQTQHAHSKDFIILLWTQCAPAWDRRSCKISK